MKSLIDLGSPALRTYETAPILYPYPVLSEQPLPFATNEQDIAFDQVIFRRRTTYGGGPLSIHNLASLLWRTAYCQQQQSFGLHNVLKHRPVISAGAIHPIDVLVVQQQSNLLSLMLYNDLEHSLLTLNVASDAVTPLWEKAITASRNTQSTLFWFVAQVDKTISKYEWPDTLIWRDAGAMMQQFSLVARALGLNCVPLGPTGNPEIEQIFQSNGSLLGVGGCFVSESEN